LHQLLSIIEVSTFLIIQSTSESIQEINS